MPIPSGDFPGISRTFDAPAVEEPAAPDAATQAEAPPPAPATPPAAASLRPGSFGIQSALIGDVIKQAASTIRAAALRATIESTGATLTPDQAATMAEEIRNDTFLTDDDRRSVQAALLGKVSADALDEVIGRDDDSSTMALILATDPSLQPRFAELNQGLKPSVMVAVADATTLSPEQKGRALAELISETDPADVDNLFENIEINHEHTQVLDLLSRSQDGVAGLVRYLTPENAAAVREVYERLTERATDPTDRDRALRAGDVVQTHVANEPAQYREAYRAERKRLQEE